MKENEVKTSEILKRFEYLMDVEGMSKKAFTEHIGFHYSNFNEIMNGTRKIPKSLTKKICAAFPDLRPQWLFLGDGEMYVSEQEAANAEKMQGLCQTRPRVPISVCLTEPKEDLDLSQFEQVPMLRGVPDYDVTCYAIGDAMVPRYEPNDEVALKEVELNEIYEWGKDYVLLTEVGVFFRKIFDAGEFIRCVAYNNEAYPEFNLPKSKIRRYFKVVGMLRLV